MNNVKIVTDSAAALSPTTIQDLNITIIDLPIFINGKLYSSVNRISSNKFLHLLANCSSQPTIGTVHVDDLIKLYNDLGSDGSQIISIHLSSALSPTFKTAQLAAQKSTSHVLVIDSRATSSGLAYQVTKTVECLNAGCPVEATGQILTDLRHKTRTYFSVANNDQLINRQVISKFRGAIDRQLKTSYIFKFTNNNFNLMMRSRSHQYIETFWHNQIKKMHGENIVKLSVLHAGETKWADLIEEMLASEFPFINIETRVTKPEMASYLGLNSTGVTYLVE